MSGDNTSGTLGYLAPTSPLPEDDDVLSAILHDFVVGVTGLGTNLVFPRWQAQPPTMPPANVNWAAIGVTLYDTVYLWPEMRHFDGYSVQIEEQTLDVIATFYGPGSGSLASLFRSGLTVRQNLDKIGTFGIKLHRIGAITRVPELINTQYIPRSDVSFHLIRELTRTYNILNIIEAAPTLISDTGYSVVADVTASTVLYPET